MGYVAEKSGDGHFVTVGLDHEEEHGNATPLNRPSKARTAVGSAGSLAFDVQASATNPSVLA